MKDQDAGRQSNWGAVSPYRHWAGWGWYLSRLLFCGGNIFISTSENQGKVGSVKAHFSGSAVLIDAGTGWEPGEGDVLTPLGSGGRPVPQATWCAHGCHKLYPTWQGGRLPAAGHHNLRSRSAAAETEPTPQSQHPPRSRGSFRHYRHQDGLLSGTT